MHNYLINILDKKKEEIETLYQRYGFEHFTKSPAPFPKRSFIQAISKPNQLNLIAEIKKASPSKGIIRQEFEPELLANEFEKNNASALSILTEKHYFLGKPEFIRAIKPHTTLPILRKDFILDEIQIFESNVIGADAILLIKALLDNKTCEAFIKLANSLQLDVLLEIHNEQELEDIINFDGEFIIGINNRNLTTFEVNTDITLKLNQLVKNKKLKQPIVAESGYSKASECEELQFNNLNAVLIGEGLAKSQELINFFNP